MWSKEEDLLLKKVYNFESKEKILAILPNRTWEAIRQRAKGKLKIKSKFHWTQEENDYLRKFYKIKSIKEIAVNLPNRALQSIRTQAAKLRISRNPNWQEAEIAYLKKNYSDGNKEEILVNLPNRSWKSIQLCGSQKLGLSRKNETQFKKGLEPWNKNLKGIHVSPKSEFKKGHSAWNKGSHWIKEQRSGREEYFRQRKGVWVNPLKGKFAIHTPLKKMLRSSHLYGDWSKAVLERDNYTCQECDQYGGKLHAHHRKTFQAILTEFLEIYDQFSPIEDKETLFRLAIKYHPFWDIDNGRTLCKKCHDLIPKVQIFNRVGGRVK